MYTVATVVTYININIHHRTSTTVPTRTMLQALTGVRVVINRIKNGERDNKVHTFSPRLTFDGDKKILSKKTT